MNCKFCNNKLTHLNPAAKGPQSVNVYDCFYCPRSTRFFYTGDNLDGYIIFVNKQDKQFNNHLFAVVFDLKKDTAGLFPVDKWGSSVDRYWESYKMQDPIARFGHVPNITPTNIYEKLKLYLIFT
jgi:hypothetical protein